MSTLTGLPGKKPTRKKIIEKAIKNFRQQIKGEKGLDITGGYCKNHRWKGLYIECQTLSYGGYYYRKTLVKLVVENYIK